MTPRLGLCSFSSHQQWKAVQQHQPGTLFSDAPTFFEYVRSLGGHGVQTGVHSAEEARAMRIRLDATGGYYEGELRLPRDEPDLGTFETNVKLARDAGASVARTVLLWTRRYETFHSMAEVREFRAHAKTVLQLCEPILKKHGLRLALENHKDQLVGEQVELLQHFSSEWIGVCVDTGNNLALLEEPNAVIEALAPFAASVHFKDMALQKSDDGFLLSEVPLGQGFLDLSGVVTTLRKANPAIVFNLEMATRDPLHIPCLSQDYWNVFEDRPARELAQALTLVSQHPPGNPPPATTGKSLPDILAAEDANNRKSLAWMQAHIV